jgi:RNA polymerase sigma-70 factor, ECF subfamily
VVSPRESLNTRSTSGVYMDDRSDLRDGQLVRLARSGDEGAFASLVNRYRRAAYSVAFGVAGRHEDAEDAAQESFLVALERLEECRNPEKFAGWFLTIVRNRARNLIRRERLREGEPLPFTLRTGDAGPDDWVERVELRDRLRAALEELTPVQREVVLLHDLEGWKHREISERLDMPSGTIRSHLHYARKRLRELLEPAEGPAMEEKTR